MRIDLTIFIITRNYVSAGTFFEIIPISSQQAMCLHKQQKCLKHACLHHTILKEVKGEKSDFQTELKMFRNWKKYYRAKKVYQLFYKSLIAKNKEKRNKNNDFENNGTR